MSYGCPELLDGSPIGGGVGYLQTFKATDARYVVGTAADLKSALASALSGQMVYIADSSTCLVNSSTIYAEKEWVHVPSGVLLVAGRGRSGIVPGCIRFDPSLIAGLTTSNYRTCINALASSKIMGINIYGPDESTAQTNACNGVIARDYVEVANNEIHGFGHCGVWPMYTNVWVHHNHIHHNQATGLGYGVTTNGTSGLVVPIYEGNKFENNRHHHAAGAGKYVNGRYASFEFRYNLLGTSTNSQLDVHGMDANGVHVGAGARWSFNHNTSTGLTGPFVGIRGIPTELGEVKDNWTYLPEDRWYSGPSSSDLWVQTINEQMYRIPGYGYQALYDRNNTTKVVTGPHAWVRMEVGPNWFGTTPPPSELRKMAVTVAVARR